MKAILLAVRAARIILLLCAILTAYSFSAWAGESSKADSYTVIVAPLKADEQLQATGLIRTHISQLEGIVVKELPASEYPLADNDTGIVSRSKAQDFLRNHGADLLVSGNLQPTSFGHVAALSFASEWASDAAQIPFPDGEILVPIIVRKNYVSPILAYNLHKAVSHKYTRIEHPILWGRAALEAGQELMKGDLCMPVGGVFYQAAITGRLNLPPQADCTSDAFDEAAQLVSLSREVLTFEASETLWTLAAEETAEIALLSGLRQGNKELLSLSQVIATKLSDVAQNLDRRNANTLRFQSLLLQMVVGNQLEDTAHLEKTLLALESIPCPYQASHPVGSALCDFAVGVARMSYGRLNEDRSIVLSGVELYEQGLRNLGERTALSNHIRFLLDVGHARALLEQGVALEDEGPIRTAEENINRISQYRVHPMQPEINSELLRIVERYRSVMN
jgi:hypothetical protein